MDDETTDEIELPEGVHINQIQNMDDLVAFCTECGSDQPKSYEKLPTYGGGTHNTPPCRFCHGVVAITFREVKAQAYESAQRQRGL